MDHGLFKPKSFEEGQHAVVGDCNGYSMTERFRLETPLFAKAILRHAQGLHNPIILDYGCGVGRLAREILSQCPDAIITGVDDSAAMREKATKYVNNKNFTALSPGEFDEFSREGVAFDLAYCVYVLQHVPAIEIRDILRRIRQTLDGRFVYCSSDFRMAVRFDSDAFFDDRFLGVNLYEEVVRFFGEPIDGLFTNEEFAANPILEDMIQAKRGGLAHPALVFSTIPKEDTYEVAREEITEKTATVSVEIEPRKVLLMHRLSPGDILAMTPVIRDLHLAFPDRFKTDVRSPCPEIFENNPYITKLEYDNAAYEAFNAHCKAMNNKDLDPNHRKRMNGDVLMLDMHYPLINASGKTGAHFTQGYYEYLEKALGVWIPYTNLYPELYLNQNEQLWPSPVVVKNGYSGKYWAINAGNKGDFELKQYHRYQEVADMLKGIVTLVQIGHRDHTHPALTGVVDMRGQTNLRELFRVIYHAEGVITCVSLPMHVAAAFYKPCVVVAGAREGTRWEMYPNQQFLYVNGCLPCSAQPQFGDGCWRSKMKDCKYLSNNVPKCLSLIRPEDIVRAVNLYYDGGMLVREEMAVAS